MIKAFRKSAIAYAIIVFVVFYFLLAWRAESAAETKYIDLLDIKDRTIDALQTQQGVLALDTDISGSNKS